MSEDAIRALLWEREGYRRRGLDGRVKAVDAELDRLGYETADDPGQKETTALPRPSSAPKFQCDQCDYVAKSKAGLGAHRRKHNAE